MANDEQVIRALLATWNQASAAGDLERILPLMAEDAVFLTAGHPPMVGREAFAASFRQVSAQFRMEPVAEVAEIAVSGDLAYCWTRLEVTMIPRPGGEPRTRRGHTLTVLRRQADGRWVLARDANLLGPISP